MRTTQRATARGFSLLELMLVLVILGVLSAVVAVSVVGQAGKAKRRATITSMETIKGALTTYQLDYNAFPPTLLTLTQIKGGLDPSKPIKDGWDRDFYYTVPGTDPSQPYTFISMGDDGAAGTADDINVWTMHLNKQ